MIELTNEEIQSKVVDLLRKIVKDNFSNGQHHFIKIYGVPRGGIPVAYLLKGHFLDAIVVDTPEEATIIVDDILDSGETKHRYIQEYGKPFYTLVKKSTEWIHFPWEMKDERTPVADNILRIEQYLDSATDEEKKDVYNSLSHIKDMCLEDATKR